MSKHNSKIAAMSARIGRIERKCNRLLCEVASLRKALTPQYSDIDEVIGHLHRTAIALREQSKGERRYYSRNAREV